MPTPQPTSEGVQVIGSSQAMRKIQRTMATLARHDLRMVFTGETGTGKSMLARHLHALSGRPGPFHTLNCGAVPTGTFEGELFGWRRGAFTDAKRDHPGALVRADRGTLLLDEVAELPPHQQVKLLTALDEETVTPLGAREGVSFDVRFVSTTNRDLERERQGGRLRSDFYYRVMEYEIFVPPLRERPEDVAELIRHFLPKDGAGSVSAKAMALWTDYGWPGNVRELRRDVRLAHALAAPGTIQPEHVLTTVRGDPSNTQSMFEVGPQSAELARFRHAMQVLRIADGNRSEAARRLEVDPKTLRNWLYRWEKRGWLLGDWNAQSPSPSDSDQPPGG